MLTLPSKFFKLKIYDTYKKPKEQPVCIKWLNGLSVEDRILALTTIDKHVCT
jgi:hypothetical protein